MKNEECGMECGMECGNKIGHHYPSKGFTFAIRHSSFVILLLLIAALFPFAGFAQSSNRWLLIFDISSSMHSRTKGTHDIMEDLLRTGMHGQLRSGDTIGIWTFNDKLHAGEAPLQIWTPDESQIIYRHTMQYLDGLHYGKSADMNVVLTNMFNVVDVSDFITIVLFSDGDQPVNGTPFDEQINNHYKENYHHQKREDMPIITVLQARHGSFFANTVNLAPWPVDIPAIPPPPAPKHVAPQTAPAPKPAAPPPAVPPLIYDGRKENVNSSPPPPTTENSPSTMAAPAENPTGPAPPVTTEQTAAAPKVETPATLPTPSAPTEPTQPTAAAAPPAAVPESTEPQSRPAETPAPAPVAQNQSEPPASPTETANPASAAPPAVETATSTPQVNLLSARNIAIFSAAFTIIVVGLLIMSARRSRASQASLITRSLDRERQ